MANNLDRDIKKGEIVVLRKSSMANPECSLEDRLFICENGFGMYHFTAGRAIMGRWKNLDREARIDGYEIDEKETEKYQSENLLST